MYIAIQEQYGNNKTPIGLILFGPTGVILQEFNKIIDFVHREEDFYIFAVVFPFSRIVAFAEEQFAEQMTVVYNKIVVHRSNYA